MSNKSPISHLSIKILFHLFFGLIFFKTEGNSNVREFFRSGALIINITTKPPTCFDHIGYVGGVTSNGVILVSASGGTPPYTYALQSVAASEQATVGTQTLRKYCDFIKLIPLK
jgi:SprB repeat